MLGTLIVKALVKHGWPASFSIQVGYQIQINYAHPAGLKPGADFWDAVAIASRIVARTYRLHITERWGVIIFEKPYMVNDRGEFREM